MYLRRSLEISLYSKKKIVSVAFTIFLRLVMICPVHLKMSVARNYCVYFPSYGAYTPLTLLFLDI